MPPELATEPPHLPAGAISQTFTPSSQFGTGMIGDMASPLIVPDLTKEPHAKKLRSRTITSYPSLRTDLRNAGATWVDEEVVVDDGLVSSRTPKDLPAFNKALVAQVAQAQ